MNTIAFAGSNSSTSINKQLVTYAVQLYGNAQILDFNDYNIPTYDIDIEKKEGFSIDVNKFYSAIQDSSILLISFSEHNASITAVFKSYMDWCSRINPKFMTDKKIFAMSTSPGGYGGRNALEAGIKLVEKFDGTVLEEFALPKFNENFKEGKITDETLDQELKTKMNSFQEKVLK
ncbi:MAG: NAD(P)H-dependent oxidoreductase [Weeksellaceae bacterium]|nr:NAD(P)H-dependent oxidoreductase [Weeksellaceae bacterium]